MQIRKLGLKALMIDCRARNIACATRPRPRRIDRLMHRSKHNRVLAHTKVIVTTPHRYRRFAAIRFVPKRVRKLTACALNINKRTIAALYMKGFNRIGQHQIVIQKTSFRLSPTYGHAG